MKKLLGFGIPKENFESFDSSNLKGYDIKNDSISLRSMKRMEMPLKGYWQALPDGCGYDFIVKAKDTQKAAELINDTKLPYEGHESR